MLHPTFASGEDRNQQRHDANHDQAVKLHPTFASGEDRNSIRRRAASSSPSMLHPTFASGEDRNWIAVLGGGTLAIAAPDVRVG